MRILIVDDDDAFRTVLANALDKRGYRVSVAGSAIEAETIAEKDKPELAIVDLKMPGESGLSVIPKLCNLCPGIRIVVLTGYASINTAVEAIKLGAINYLTKPADANQIIAMFKEEEPATEEKAKPLQQVEMEHIQEVLNACGGNISQAAKKLGMHRRTLQRKLKRNSNTVSE